MRRPAPPLRRLAAGLSCVLLAAACGGSGGTGAPALALPPPPPPPTLAVERVFAGLPLFTQPVALLQAPGDASRWFVVEQGGSVRVFDNLPAEGAHTEFVNIADRVVAGGELGLLGMAFHPDFPANPRVYLSYTHETATSQLISRLSEFRSNDGGLTLDRNSETVLLTVAQPEPNHNGGNIAFGPDGYLYLGLGDGGGGNDPFGPIGNAQSTTTLLGKMLRIDVAGTPYGIPPDNPFAANAPCTGGSGAAACPEIFALGLRNPWRWSFDRQTDALWVADVGQGALEEVNRVVLGGNYGWRCFEGTRNTGFICGQPVTTIPPVAEYGRTVGQSITGGYVYRGSAFPALVGRYVFADVVSRRLFSIAADTPPTLTLTTADGLDTALSIVSFGEGIDGELYAVNYGGTLHRVVQATP